MTLDDIDWLDRLMAAIAAAEAGPDPADLAAAPVIDLWRPLASRSGAVALCGLVSGHPRLGNTLIVTSQLIALDADAGHARTASRWYRLGLRLPPAEAGTAKDPWSMCAARSPGILPFDDLDALSRLLLAHRSRIRKVHAAAEARRTHRRH